MNSALFAKTVTTFPDSLSAESPRGTLHMFALKMAAPAHCLSVVWQSINASLCAASIHCSRVSAPSHPGSAFLAHGQSEHGLLCCDLRGLAS